MKEALFYINLKNKVVQCQLCPHFCTLRPDQIGICKTRQNKNGKLISLSYGKVISTSAEPIEKKPMYHFLPGSFTFSIATAGCNLRCKQCQNYEISQASPKDIPSAEISPEEIVKRAKFSKCSSISYTFTEPTVFYEYMLDVAKVAKKAGLKNIVVSNGFINPKPLKELCKYVDAFNIDLKSFSEEFYKDICLAQLEPILESLKLIKKEGKWIEITNLIIPSLNDNIKDIKDMALWINQNLGRTTPLHLSKFSPYYKMKAVKPTPLLTLKRGQKAARKYLDNVYIGNIPQSEFYHTSCPKCNRVLIERVFYSAKVNALKCPCGYILDGVWR